MADLTTRTNDTTPLGTDLVYTAKSPFGATDDRKVTLSNLGKGLSGITASQIDIALGTGTPTVDQMQEYLDNTGSSGYFTGGIITLGTVGTVNISAVEGFVRASASSTAPLLSFKAAASTNFAITLDTTQYIFVNDSGVISSSTDEFLEAENLILLGVATNEGGTIVDNFNLGVRLNESIGQAGRFIRRVLSVSRDIRKGGLIFGETGTRNITLSTGVLWWGRTEYPITALDTSVSGSFYIYSGATQLNAAATQYPNTVFGDGAGGTTVMTNNRWANLFFYIEPDGDVVMVHGTAEFTSQATAEMEAVPSVLPNRLQSSAIIASRYTFQKSAATSTISSAFDTVFTNNAVATHSNLANLAWTSSGHTATAGTLGGFDGTGAAAEIATGTSGDILTSNGTGAAPTFQAAAGGGEWTLVGTLTFTNSATAQSQAVTGGVSKIFKAVYRLVDTANSGNNTIGVQVNSITTNYRYRTITTTTWVNPTGQVQWNIQTFDPLGMCWGDIQITGRSVVLFGSTAYWGMSHANWGSVGGLRATASNGDTNDTSGAANLSTIKFLPTNAVTGVIEIYERTL